MDARVWPRALPLRARKVAKARAKVGRSTVEATCARRSYDVVVVGGGAAGCVLARRLTEDPNKHVLLLEAGSEQSSPLVTVPAGITRLFKNASLDWEHYARTAAQLDGREVYLARGKVVGGSTSTNATLYHRGCKEDYDGWNVPGWSGEQVLPWFNHCEDNQQGKGTYRGTHGPVRVENPRYNNPLYKKFFQASQEVGMKHNPEFNDWSRSQEGYGAFQVTQKKGRRWDAYKAYLEPALDRPNLHLITNAHVKKVVFDGKKAVGVEYNLGGRGMSSSTVEVKPDGEVILASGAINSPHLLLLSGVGPEEQLREHGIEVVQALEGVGKNLQDQPACLTAYLGSKDISVTDHVYNHKGSLRKRAILNYLLFRRGPLATTGCDHGAFVRSKAATGKLPDLQLRYPPGCALDADGVSSYVKFGMMKQAGIKWPSGISFQVIACRPKSKGALTLRSDNPFDRPWIDHGYLTDPEGSDLASLIEGIKLTREMAASSAFGDFVEEELHPGSHVTSDQDIEAYIRRTLHSANAIVGTCALGVNPMEGAVVDGQLKVHGLEGIRVVDSSVIPIIPGGQTAAPTFMVAERAAAILGGKELKAV